MPSPPARLPVAVAGRRIKTIDVHSHCLFDEANAQIGEEGAKALIPSIDNETETFLIIEQRMKAMDSQAVDMEVLSVNPFW